MNPKNLFAMFEQFKGMQGKIQQIQDDLQNEKVEAEAGGGMVQVVVNGRQEVCKITIEPSIIINSCKTEDVEMVEDLVLAAVNAGIEKSRSLATKRLQELGGGMDVSQISQLLNLVK